MRPVLGLLLLLPPLLAACDSQWVEPPRVKSPDGSAWWYDIECDEGGLPVCQYIAAHFCKGGYDMMDAQQGRRIQGAARRSGFSTPYTATEHELLVQCKEGDAGAS